MLRALWEDTCFADGASARGIVNLPQSIQEHFKELSIQSKRYGGLAAASGTLGAGSRGSVRLALLRILFKSVGLPEQYPVACFVMWLKREGIYDSIKSRVKEKGYGWQEELDNFYVAEGLHQALVEEKPMLFSTPVACVETLNNRYPHVSDISSDEMLKAMRQALTREGKFPLTLVVLDEVQQYIGESNTQLSTDVQEAVEACSKNIGGKLLFIGTGQTAVTGTSNLKKLAGRFTLRVELSDADVDTVIRKVILGKKPDTISPIEQIMQKNLGEISRHLGETSICHHQDDMKFFAQDYPILPVRRRFWENTLRVLDQTGTDSQLRNQLSMIHKVIKTNTEEELGSVVPADYLYFDSADKLLQSRILPRKVHQKTMSWIQGSEDEQLMARASGLVFLINKLAGSNNEIGIKSNVDTIADLMVTDLAKGSSSIRSKLPNLMDKCELLMKVADEYRIQTEESSAWNDEFLSQRSVLNNEAHRIEAERDDRIRQRFSQLVNRLTLTQGNSKVPRSLFTLFDSELPLDSDKKIYVWVQDGWSIEENSVRIDARQAGNHSPTVFVFIPKRSVDDLRRNLIDFKASGSTLEKRGFPNTPEGIEARAAMETTKNTAEGKIKDLLNDAFSGARVFQAGGNEIVGNNLQEMVLEAAGNSLKRLYPNFNIADHSGWDKVYSRAKQGAPDALKAVGDDGEPVKNAVCKAILGMIAAGKKGNDIRFNFEEAPYGWSRDSVDGGLQALLVAGLVRAQDERGHTIDPKGLERKYIGKTFFKIESTTITTAQRVQIRKLLQKMKLQVKQEEELVGVSSFLEKMRELSQQAGGEPPMPKTPDLSLLEELRLTAGNEQLLAVYNAREILTRCIDDWNDLAENIKKRWPSWASLQRLAHHAQGLKETEMMITQVNHIEKERQLLEKTDLLKPLVKNLTQLLRNEINRVNDMFEVCWGEGEARLQKDENWKQLDPDQKYTLRSEQQLIEAGKPKINVESTDCVLATLADISLSAFKDRVAAMPARFDRLILEATRIMEPEIQEATLPNQTLKTKADVDAWLAKTKEILLKKLKKGPVIV
ncbi:MAG: BREX system P-loop protein BrxC [Desulfobacula sp.]|jgi:hypothetical protein|nr:BREX system P-loop protein BrxC [Desulfobacula sp.]